jgi:hypothetical protein
VDGSPDEELVAIADFRLVTGFYFGSPNDEALDNHPLYSRGLSFYGVHLVEPSAWADDLRRLALCRGATPRADARRRQHFVVTMHDSLFECVAEAVDFRVVRSSMSRVAAEAAKRISSP